ncbi:MAG: ABC transporter ATP-binding protein [Actinomycetia bacterium]|nr:ABC transporter ATP-binding protein [Actinomycetes bacterium]
MSEHDASGRTGAPAIACDNLVKIYKVGDLEAIALQGLDLVVERGEFVAIVGASGSGKSTLLGILGGLVTPSAGSATVAGYDLLKMSTRQRISYRRDQIGFVWQQASRNLLPYLTAVENVEVPMSLSGLSRSKRRKRSLALLSQMGVADRFGHRPHQMSGGEQQRVAIAVALANDPSVIFADEPTGELDTRTAAEMVEVLNRVNDERGVTVVVVTHDMQLAGNVGRTIALRDGRTSGEVLRREGYSPDGTRTVVAEEFAVLDRVGRLQLPSEYVDALDLEHRVRLTLDSDRINVWPDQPLRGRPSFEEGDIDE